MNVTNATNATLNGISWNGIQSVEFKAPLDCPHCLYCQHFIEENGVTDGYICKLDKREVGPEITCGYFVKKVEGNERGVIL